MSGSVTIIGLDLEERHDGGMFRCESRDLMKNGMVERCESI
jgi:hypothetical protein